MPKKTTTIWTVNNFPIQLKNKFAGRAKEKGIKIPDLLKKVIEDYLASRESD